MAVGHVDGDALLALGLETVGEQGEVHFADRDRGAAPARLPGVLELVLGDGARLSEKPADEGRLAVVDRTARDKADNRGDVDAG